MRRRGLFQVAKSRSHHELAFWANHGPRPPPLERRSCSPKSPRATRGPHRESRPRKPCSPLHSSRRPIKEIPSSHNGGSLSRGSTERLSWPTGDATAPTTGSKAGSTVTAAPEPPQTAGSTVTTAPESPQRLARPAMVPRIGQLTVPTSTSWPPSDKSPPAGPSETSTPSSAKESIPG